MIILILWTYELGTRLNVWTQCHRPLCFLSICACVCVCANAPASHSHPPVAASPRCCRGLAGRLSSGCARWESSQTPPTSLRWWTAPRWPPAAHKQEQTRQTKLAASTYSTAREPEGTHMSICVFLCAVIHPSWITLHNPWLIHRMDYMVNLQVSTLITTWITRRVGLKETKSQNCMAGRDSTLFIDDLKLLVVPNITFWGWTL